MQFRSNHGQIPDSHFDNEVAVSKNPNDRYSAEFVEIPTKDSAAGAEGSASCQTPNTDDGP